MKISKIKARQIFDSRGYPTVEADVYLEDGSFGRSAVPSGASKGSKEALELRDGGGAYGGNGVEKAVSNINNVIASALVGQSAEHQSTVDKHLIALDGTEHKTNLGANATLAVSLAIAKAAANYHKQPLFRYIALLSGHSSTELPMPMCNILNGGKHASHSTDIQEFMIVPVGAKDIQQALQICSEVFHSLAKVLAKKDYATTVGDEGGYAPSLKGGTQEALELIGDAVQLAGYKLGDDVAFAVDVAATELYKDAVYNFGYEQKKFTSDQLIQWYGELCRDYPLISIEDGLAEDDWQGWQKLNQALGAKCQLVGDDLLVTNTHLLNKAIKDKACNSILIKPNQIGTLSETTEAVITAQKAGWRTIVSHRSGETEDTTIAHLAVGLNAGQIKTGSFSRSERLAKYNELLRIAELLPHTRLAKPFST
jgi:enolase